MELSKDLAAKAKWVADMMAEDGVKAEQVTTELVIAYMAAIERKINQIQATYLCQPNAKDTMRATVLAIL